MCAVVLVIGASVWGVASGASSIMRSDYFDEVMESVEKIKERFYIENIGINITSSPSIQICVLNYGSTTINITRIRIEGGGSFYNYYPPDNVPKTPPNGILIQAEDLFIFVVAQSEVSLKCGQILSVRVESERENRAYDSIRIP